MVLSMPRVVPMLLALLAAASISACDARQPVATGGAAALARNLAHVRVVELHVEEESAAEPLRRLAALERARSGLDVRVLVQAPGDLGAARIVVGTPRSGLASRLAARAGLTLLEGDAIGFRVGGLDHDDPDDAACATFADPDRPGLPVTVWLGNDLARLLPQIEDAIPRAFPTFSTWRGGDLVLRGKLRVEGGLRPLEVVRVGLERSELRGPTTALGPSDAFAVEVADVLEPETVARAVRDLDAARERASGWTGAPIPQVAVRLLASVEDLRLGGEHDSLGRWNRARPAADAVVVSGATDGGAAAVRAGLRAAFGPAVVGWIEQGASVSAARSWWGRDLDRWLTNLVLAGGVPRVEVLVDPRSDARISPHVLAPARAALFDHLRASRGDAFVRGVWYGTRALAVDADLEASYAAALAARTEPFRAEVAHRAKQRRDKALGAPPIAGVALVESAPDPRRGYGSRAALEALAATAARGARSIELEATFLGARVDEPLAASRALGPASGDAALFTTAIAAGNRGVRVALQVDVLASDAGSYSGAWTRDLEPEWIAYFEEHARAVEHAGLLANLCGADWLVVGSSVRGVSSISSDERRTRPEELVWRSDGWRRVIGAARGAFPGGLTYGAGDVLEAADIRFWGDLDAIGLELAPRAEHGAPNPRVDVEGRLLQALASLEPIAQRCERPVLLTRVTLAPVLDAASALDWPSVQVGLLADAVRSATVDRGLDLRAAWLWRVGTDPADRGANARDPVLPREADAALGAFFAGAPAWVREGSRSVERSPR